MLKSRKLKPYSEQELKVIGEKAALIPGRPATKVFNTPISYRENSLSLFWDKRPCFVVTGNDFSGLNCGYWSKNLARSNRAEPNKIDTFGVKWVFEPTAGGSISVAGNPRFTDVNNWKDVIRIPDVEDWDWETDAKDHPVDSRFPVEMTFTNGFWFERLVSLMDFVNAAMALIDEEQTAAIQELFEAMTEMGCKIVDKIAHYWPSLDGIIIHDDWGSQKSPFFSEKVARELFLPHMQKLIRHIHEKGLYVGIHSCGHVESRVPIFIEAGLDTWQMQWNANPNIDEYYQKYGDKFVFQITIPEFDLADEKKAVELAHEYVDRYCQPGKPTMMIPKNAMQSPVFAEEIYEYSRKHYLSM